MASVLHLRVHGVCLLDERPWRWAWAQLKCAHVRWARWRALLAASAHRACARRCLAEVCGRSG